jgi:hypothetical protein
MPILWDWRKLFEQVPQTEDAYERLLTRLYGERLPAHVLPLHEQRRVLQAARIAEAYQLVKTKDPARIVPWRGRHQRLATYVFGFEDIFSR